MQILKGAGIWQPPSASAWPSPTLSADWAGRRLEHSLKSPSLLLLPLCKSSRPQTYRMPLKVRAANSTSSRIAPEEQQTKRILWIMPNFRAVSAGTKLPKQSVKEKFKTAALDSFDYSSFVFAGIQAGISQATDAYAEFHQGLAGYGRYYWHTFADQTDENLWV